MGKMRSRFILVALAIISIAFLVNGAIAQESDANNKLQEEKAYSCLKSEINNKSSLTLEQALFAGLALGGEKKIMDTLESEKDLKNCWPKQKCAVRESAIALLVYDRSGKDTKGIIDWILSNNKTADELNWYLEIHIGDMSEGECKISYDGRSGSITIKEDMTLTKNTAGECLSISSNQYWLKISQRCIDLQFEISCNKDFVTSLIYEKKIGETIYVSSESNSASEGSSTKEKVNSLCLASGKTCDYEGTLWAAYSLNKLGKDISPFLPYLSAFAEDNTRYFPSSLLFAVSSRDESSDFLTDIIQRQNQDNIWSIAGSKYRKFYDTSLAMIGLSSMTKSLELDAARASLIKMQKPSGCWSDRDAIIDTGFLLYSGWFRAGKTSGGTGALIKGKCDSVIGQSCENNADCREAGGDILNEFECSGGDICCSVEVPEKSCSAQGGLICPIDKECDGLSIPSSEGSCCMSVCKDVGVVESTCGNYGGLCKVSCDSTETEIDETCLGFEVCCFANEEVNEGPNWFLIILLIILIALVVIAIIYRDKIRIWWYGWRGKANVKPVTRPGVPPATNEKPVNDFNRVPPKFAPQNTQKPIIRPQYTGPANYNKPSVPPRDKEMEETMKKLREMTK
jgi:hypothetical protein